MLILTTVFLHIGEVMHTGNEGTPHVELYQRGVHRCSPDECGEKQHVNHALRG